MWDKDGFLFLDVVVNEGEFDCVSFLIEKGVNINYIWDGFIDKNLLYGRKRVMIIE